MKNNTLDPIDETEFIHIDINDDILKNSRIAAYNVGQTLPDKDKPGKEIPVNPKRFPTKAVNIIFPYDTLIINLFFDPYSKSWDSDVVYNDEHGKLSPDQFGQFFNSSFYSRLLTKFKNYWPLSDKFYNELYTGLCEKEMKTGPDKELNEDNDSSMANKDVTNDGKRDYTASGRKIIKFTDINVNSKDANFYCWPDTKKLDRWSTWKDWNKIKPLCKIKFLYNKIPFSISTNIYKEEKDLKNRGFRGIDHDPELVPVQWLTKEETSQIMKLSIVDKFIRHCKEKLTKYITIPPEEIYKNIQFKDKITIEEIKTTQELIRRTLNSIIKTKQIESFRWR